VADALRGLADRVNQLEGLVAELTGKRPEPGQVTPLRRRGPDPAGG
jgi:hypothetical protein